MKKTSIIFIVILTLSSCNKDKEPTSVGKIFNDYFAPVAIVDEAYNDRLNPKSISYFGKEYVKGIEVMYLCNGQKFPYSRYCSFIGAIYNSDFSWIRTPPDGSDEYYTVQPYNKAQYSKDGKIFTTSYICYPDGNEVRVTTQILKKNDGRTDISKIWINDELAFDTARGGYYNPKYYPYRYDHEGNPLTITLCITVITK